MPENDREALLGVCLLIDVINDVITRHPFIILLAIYLDLVSKMFLLFLLICMATQYLLWAVLARGREQ